MAIENEIVKFSAQIQMDEQAAAAVQKAFADTNSRCQELRDAISKTNEEMMRLRLEGKEDTDQFKALEASLKADTKALRESSKEADKYAAKLGLFQMSMKQLQERSKALKKELATMHKEADPKRWNQYQKELKATEDRIKELKGGTAKTGSAMKGLGASIAGGFTVGTLAVKAIGAAVNVAKKAFQTFTTATQTWADQWQIATEMAKAGWQQFIANIGQGTNVMKASIKEAMEAAKEAAQLRDELFERNNSYKLMEADARVYINTQTEIANNSANDANTRMQALDNIMAKEKELAEAKKSIAQQDMDAALLLLRTRTQMSDEQIQSVVDQYEQNREIIQQAGEYNNQLKSIQDSIELWEWTLSQADDALAEDIATERIEAAKQKLDELVTGTAEDVKQFASMSAQYNLANDDLVKAYVDAKLSMKQADEELTASSAAQARKRGTLQKQIAADEKAARDKAYQDRINAAQAAYNKELLSLKTALLNQEITQEEFSAKSQTAEMKMLESKRAINLAYGKDVVDIDTQITDRRLKVQQEMQAALKKSEEEFAKWMAGQIKADEDAMQQMLNETEAEIEGMMSEVDRELQQYLDHIQDLQDDARVNAAGKTQKLSVASSDYNDELSRIQEMHDLQLIDEEEFLARREELRTEYAKRVAEIETESWSNALGMASQMLNEISALSQMCQEAETTQLEAEYNKRIAAAEGNVEEQERLKEEEEAKKLEIQKKYADIDMGINIAKAVASGAVAAIRAFADLGPIAGAVMAALIAATTAAEVAVIIAQRNAIKSQTSGGSSNITGAGNTVGFSDGGYTGDGQRLEVAGVVHKGEYVVPQPILRDPSVAAMVASIETKRRAHSTKNALPGYAEGGYTTPEAPDTSESTAKLDAIYDVLLTIASQPIPAYVMLSDMERQQQKRDRFKQFTSLKK